MPMTASKRGVNLKLPIHSKAGKVFQCGTPWRNCAYIACLTPGRQQDEVNKQQQMECKMNPSCFTALGPCLKHPLVVACSLHTHVTRMTTTVLNKSALRAKSLTSLSASPSTCANTLAFAVAHQPKSGIAGLLEGGSHNMVNSGHARAEVVTPTFSPSAMERARNCLAQ